jgi:hypothetical protein
MSPDPTKLNTLHRIQAFIRFYTYRARKMDDPMIYFLEVDHEDRGRRPAGNDRMICEGGKI